MFSFFPCDLDSTRVAPGLARGTLTGLPIRNAYNVSQLFFYSPRLGYQLQKANSYTLMVNKDMCSLPEQWTTKVLQLILWTPTSKLSALSVRSTGHLMNKCSPLPSCRRLEGAIYMAPKKDPAGWSQLPQRWPTCKHTFVLAFPPSLFHSSILLILFLRITFPNKLSTCKPVLWRILGYDRRHQVPV